MLASHVPLRPKDGEAVSFFVRREEGDNQFFVNPYTGDVQGSRRWGDITQGSKNLMPFVYRLHYSLALDDIGILLFGVVALLWTLDCFVGAYLTFPPRRQAKPTARRRSWFARWKKSWLIRTTKLFSFVFTWHRASGLWLWAILFVFAWSAVAFNLDEVYRPVMRTLFPMNEQAYKLLPKLEEPRKTPRLSFAEAHRIGKAMMEEQAVLQDFRIFEGHGLRYDASHGVYRYRVRSSRDISDRYPGTTLWLDGDTGRFVAFEAPTGERLGNTVSSWLVHLHLGSISAGGLLYRIFVSFVGLAVAVLSITGVWIWWKKRSRSTA